MLGLWMLETRISPVSEVATISFAVFPSEPGAPPGHKGIAGGGSAADNETDISTAQRIEFALFIGSSSW
jgi:hypothetical protein